MCGTLYFASRDRPEVKDGYGGHVLLRMSRFAASSLRRTRSLPDLRAPRTKTQCPRAGTQSQTPEPCSEGIRSMCLTQINCLPASLCLDTACSWVFCCPGGRRETCGLNKPPECCVMSVGMLAFVALALKSLSAILHHYCWEKKFQRGCQKKSMVPL